MLSIWCLIGVSNTSHTTHYAKHVIRGGVNTDLSSGGSTDSGGGKNKLKGGVINSGEVATSRRLVLLGAKGEGVGVDTGIRGTGVVLERLDNIEVRTLTLGETVLSVKLKLSGDDRVLTPAMHVEGSLGKDESSGIRDVRTFSIRCSLIETIPLGTISTAHGSRVLEKTT